MGGAPGRACRAGSTRRTIPESFVDLTIPVRTLFDFEKSRNGLIGKMHVRDMAEFVAIYVRAIGKNTDDGVG